MANFYRDNDDLRYYLEGGGVDWETIVSLKEPVLDESIGFGSVEDAVAFYKDVVEMVGRFTAEKIAPRAAEMEREGAHLVDGKVKMPEAMDEIFDEIAQLGIHGMCLPREVGGLNCPLMLYLLNCELFSRADASMMTHHGFHGGIAMALLVYSIHEGTTTFDPETGELLETRFSEAIEELISGEVNGCMDITEPDAGSDMGALRTRAEQDEEGNWFVTGQKIFITSGHGKYHIVICKSEDEDEQAEDPMGGLKALSTFLVPAWSEDEDGERTYYATVDRLEEKIGHHASATCSVIFERAPAQLIGERGQGFKHMLLLMNNARIGVGFEALGLAEAAYRMACEYAEERVAFGKTIDQHELIAERLDRMENELRAIRALAVQAAFHEECAVTADMNLRRGGKVTDLERARLQKMHRRHKRRARRATPLLKFLAAEKAVEMARENMQIHGGVGYTTEYGAEKLLRDALVMPIYEGTTQIQALMAMKDKLSQVLKNPQRWLRGAAQARWRALSSRDPRSKQLARLQSLSYSAQQTLLARTVFDKVRAVQDLPPSDWLQALRKDWDPKRDFAHAMLHAERLTTILTDELIAEILLEQGQQHPQRMEIFDRHMEQAEPRARYMLDQILHTGDRVIDRLHQPGLEEESAAGE